VNEQDRAKILAFVHGELDQLETQKLATRIEAEEPLRQEFEALLSASDALEDLFLQPAKDDLSPKQIQAIMSQAKGPSKMPKLTAIPRPRKSFFIAGGAVFAASLAFVLFMKMDKPQHEELQAETAMMDARPAAQQASAPPADAGAGVPPVDNLAAQEAPPAEADPQQTVAMNEGARSKDRRAAAPSKVGKGAAKMGDLAKKKEAAAFGQNENVSAEAETSSDMLVADSAPMAAAPPPQAAGESIPMEAAAKAQSTRADAMMLTGATPKKMGVIASRVKFTKNMNNKKAMLYLQQKLDGKTSCIPTQLSMIKTMQVVIAVDKTGLIKSIKTTPASPDTAKCLKAKLGNKPAAFKPANKANGTITVQLKNF